MINIVVINDCQCLIYENEFDVENVNDAIKEMLERDNVTLAIGDVIQIR